MLTQCGSIFCIYIFLNVYSVSFIFNYLCTYVLKKCCETAYKISYNIQHLFHLRNKNLLWECAENDDFCHQFHFKFNIFLSL